jgi:nucleotide-binding universal stress UspA family protein
MLRSLLVPLDGSTFSERSLPFAGKVAHATGGSVHLAHVHVPYEPDHLLGNTQFQFEGVNMAEYDAHHREREEVYLSGLADGLSREGTPADAKILDGREVAEELAAYADEVHTDMIFMTTHGYSGANRLWLGSVADEMIRHTGLPMFVIHPEERAALPDRVFSVRRILIPLDGSKLAESVLGPATELARATGARITLLNVVPMPELSGWPVLESLRERPVPKLDGAIAYLEGVADELRLEGYEVQTHALRAPHAATAIVSAADKFNADVIALATHGYGGLKRTLLGSVADKLLRSSVLPLLVMRPAMVA